MDLRHPHPDCDECNEYMERRADVLPLYIVAVARSRGIHAGSLVVAYFRAVHDRHLAGMSLDTS